MCLPSAMVMAKAGVTLQDFTYTRPRQSLCVTYPAPGNARRFKAWTWRCERFSAGAIPAQQQ